MHPVFGRNCNLSESIMTFKSGSAVEKTAFPKEDNFSRYTGSDTFRTLRVKLHLKTLSAFLITEDFKDRRDKKIL